MRNWWEEVFGVFGRRDSVEGVVLFDVRRDGFVYW